MTHHRNYLGRLASVQSGNKFIRQVGWATAKTENANGRPLRVWRIVAGCK